MIAFLRGQTKADRGEKRLKDKLPTGPGCPAGIRTTCLRRGDQDRRFLGIPLTDAGNRCLPGQRSGLSRGSISFRRAIRSRLRAHGYDLRTVQQPLADRNMGALIGKVVIAVTVIKDPNTGRRDQRRPLSSFMSAGAAGDAGQRPTFLGSMSLS